MSHKTKRIVRAVVGGILALAFLYLAFRNVKFAELLDSVLRVNVFWVFVLVPVGLAGHWIRAVRWAYLLAPVKSNISTRNLFSAVMIGYMINNILPRVGELVRPYVIGKLEGISKSSAFGSVVAERIIDMVSFFFIMCLVFFVYPNSLDPFVDDPAMARPLFLIGSVVAMILFVALFLKIDVLWKIVGLIHPLLPRRFESRIDGIVQSFVSGFAVSKMPEKFAPLAATSFLLWIVYALGLYIAFFAFDPIAELGLGFGASVVLLVMSALAFILPAPGAFGTYHSFLTLALVRLYGVNDVTALSYTILTHELGYVVVMVVGVYYFLKDNFKVSEVRLEVARET
ncbi:MAG TPA: lysylphosphatidylglycerol synthase transmembrane domain-containing protein [Bacteroidota bacterium]|nr:lysylphosphatidylglycerol synthase transmembrane domain-containing protein [Bacteroidota bacterium]